MQTNDGNVMKTYTFPKIEKRSGTKIKGDNKYNWQTCVELIFKYLFNIYFHTHKSLINDDILCLFR